MMVRKDFSEEGTLEKKTEWTKVESRVKSVRGRSIPERDRNLGRRERHSWWLQTPGLQEALSQCSGGAVYPLNFHLHKITFMQVVLIDLHN